MSGNKVSEKDTQNSIIDYLRSLDIHCWPVNNTGIYDPTMKRFRRPSRRFMPGISDIMAVIEGRMVAIEVKSLVGKLSPEQRVFLARVNQEGGIAFVARSVRQVHEELLKHFPKIFIN